MILKKDSSLYQITVSFPGWMEEELEIDTIGGNLNVYAKHSEDTLDEIESSVYREIRRTDFQLSFSFPEHTNVHGARLENGLLQIDIYQGNL